MIEADWPEQARGTDKCDGEEIRGESGKFHGFLTFQECISKSHQSAEQNRAEPD